MHLIAKLKLETRLKWIYFLDNETEKRNLLEFNSTEMLFIANPHLT